MKALVGALSGTAVYWWIVDRITARYPVAQTRLRPATFRAQPYEA